MSRMKVVYNVQSTSDARKIKYFNAAFPIPAILNALLLQSEDVWKFWFCTFYNGSCVLMPGVATRLVEQDYKVLELC